MRSSTSPSRLQTSISSCLFSCPFLQLSTRSYCCCLWHGVAPNSVPGIGCTTGQRLPARTETAVPILGELQLFFEIWLWHSRVRFCVASVLVPHKLPSFNYTIIKHVFNNYLVLSMECWNDWHLAENKEFHVSLVTAKFWSCDNLVPFFPGTIIVFFLNLLQVWHWHT
jgi:hypothetical protein